MRSILVCAAALTSGVSARRRYSTKSYKSPSSVIAGKINVHLVPHSHDDVGWLKTVDQYATGGNNSIQHANTGLTIGSVLQNLRDNSDRTFSYVEQAFFQRWVEQADDDQLAEMRAAVASGQMVFLNGAYSMHDEASPSCEGPNRALLTRALCCASRGKSEFSSSSFPNPPFPFLPTRRGHDRQHCARAPPHF